MEALKIGGRFKLVCPDGFRLTTAEEQDRLHRMSDEGETLCLVNEEGHMIVSIGWKEVNAFAGLVLRLIRPVSSVEANVNRAMAPYGYRKETDLSREIGGRPGQGFRYTYVADDTPMVGETYVIREDRTLTFFHVYYRAAMRDGSLAQWNGLLDAVQPL